eukprot:TRINITY_DN2843_c0_g3_i1.p1 TRINITY_DN2843_c0_g3~~TRINITY_DN2843_c0_g3_i1.p1  ORF type:complete len:833 (-),score=126.18 TRINITY_DN2843_c0_g3_i1:153-2651(-)
METRASVRIRTTHVRGRTGQAEDFDDMTRVPDSRARATRFEGFRRPVTDLHSPLGVEEKNRQLLAAAASPTPSTVALVNVRSTTSTRKRSARNGLLGQDESVCSTDSSSSQTRGSTQTGCVLSRAEKVDRPEVAPAKTGSRFAHLYRVPQRTRAVVPTADTGADIGRHRGGQTHLESEALRQNHQHVHHLQSLCTPPHQLGGTPVEYRIVIPTRGRWRQACEISTEKSLRGVSTPFILVKTLGFLKRHRVPPRVVSLWVACDQEQFHYEAALKQDPYWGGGEVEVVVGVPGIMHQRNFIVRSLPEDTYVISLDDDLTDVLWKQFPTNGKGIQSALTTLPKGSFERLIYHAHDLLRQYKANIWGLSASSNVMSMWTDGVSTRNGEINGFFYGFLNRHVLELQPRLGDATEDAERSLRYFKHDRIVLRYRMYCGDTRCFQFAGGLQDLFHGNSLKERQHARKTAERSIAQRLHELFPAQTAPSVEKRGRATLEVNFRSIGGMVLPTSTASALRAANFAEARGRQRESAVKTVARAETKPAVTGETGLPAKLGRRTNGSAKAGTDESEVIVVSASSPAVAKASAGTSKSSSAAANDSVSAPVTELPVIPGDVSPVDVVTEEAEAEAADENAQFEALVGPWVSDESRSNGRSAGLNDKDAESMAAAAAAAAVAVTAVAAAADVQGPIKPCFMKFRDAHSETDRIRRALEDTMEDLRAKINGNVENPLEAALLESMSVLQRRRHYTRLAEAQAAAREVVVGSKPRDAPTRMLARGQSAEMLNSINLSENVEKPPPRKRRRAASISAEAKPVVQGSQRGCRLLKIPRGDRGNTRELPK